ncbi:lipoprotein-anchoring transpeptidase ErfK/SrfK [Roseibium hamelinense]|uniref:Lipoprotein-anchoring transpeptidase ErfK/SrfK n=1 Tax=Roseibium hamelinense TaxID=150831 RepID=A0A562SL02_9HYPH|nr:L,D-transpeptidase [Roseibium hamelinense]MTI43226.1 L,D-transpeptidase [Roseibium hamelinense]TWI81848.1 lipoprotein-anchoring transpeptidase ErfK/SrfK [Roseibium hamelinense]
MLKTFSRRAVVIGLPLALAACQSKQSSVVQAGLTPRSDGTPNYASAYAPVRDGGFNLPGIDYQNFDPQYLRQTVFYPSRYPVGTVVVDPRKKFLYLIQPGGRAIRYGIGVGRAGFAWNGEAEIRFKREWPKWFPPDEMIEREPHLEKYRDGQDGGPSNPIGARGLYLWQNNKDTLYRIHGTNQPSSIGTNASSGCIRMWQQDIIDLYKRVELGAKVVVLS